MSRRLRRLALLANSSMRRERIFRDRRNPLDIFNDSELLQRYRFSRRGIMFLTEILTNDLEYSTRRNFALLPCMQILIALQFYATGTFQAVCGDPLQVITILVLRENV